MRGDKKCPNTLALEVASRLCMSLHLILEIPEESYSTQFSLSRLLKAINGLYRYPTVIFFDSRFKQ